MRTLVLVVAAAALAGCAGMNSSSSRTTYIRADGQPVSQEQLDASQSDCKSSDEKAYRCMVAKGYFLVDVKDADVKQAQFAQIADESRKREEARVAELARQQEELAAAERRKARKKKKRPLKPAN
jgi:outer membrane PBP1 activator LpoA protein